MFWSLPARTFYDELSSFKPEVLFGGISHPKTKIPIPEKSQFPKNPEKKITNLRNFWGFQIPDLNPREFFDLAQNEKSPSRGSGIPKKFHPKATSALNRLFALKSSKN